MRKILDYKEQILDLIHKGHSTKDISNIVNFSKTTVKNFKNIYCKDKIYPEITLLNEAVIIGTVLGDASIYKGKTDKYCKLQWQHGKEQLEYSKWKFNLILNLGANLKEYVRKTPNAKTGKYYKYNICFTRNNLYLNKYRELLYTNEKIITEETMLKYTNLSLAVHYMDDGFTDGKDYFISTDCFNKASLDIFTNSLYNKFNLKTSINKSNKVRIKSESRHIFESLIYFYIIQVPCMHYKLLTSRNSVNCLETPEEDNQQPSSCGDTEKGSTTSSESQVDNNSTTKAGHF